MKKNLSIKNKVVKNIFASLVGFINGFFGGGGGLICVPTLEKIYGLDEKKSHATAMAVIFPLSIVSAVVYGLKTQIDWLNLLYVTLGVVMGGIVGALLLKKLNGATIRIIFIIIMLAAGIRMLF